jgi:hypothetical protein
MEIAPGRVIHDIDQTANGKGLSPHRLIGLWVVGRGDDQSRPGQIAGVFSLNKVDRRLNLRRSASPIKGLMTIGRAPAWRRAATLRAATSPPPITTQGRLAVSTRMMG